MSIIVNSHLLFTELRNDLKKIYDGSEPDFLSFWIIEDLLGITKAQVLVREEIPIDPEKFDHFQQSRGRLIQGYPIQHILGYAYFMEHTFKVTPDVLIPRPETEELVLTASKNVLDSAQLLDIGTGSGCIAIALKKQLPSLAVHAWDESSQALEVAKLNARELQADVVFSQQDVFEKWPDQTWDFIVSNPPYIQEKEKDLMHTNVLDHEPELALFVPDEHPLIFYTRIVDQGQKHLKSGGFLLFEINESFGQEMLEMMKQKGLKNVQLLKDGFGKDRMTIGQKA